VLRRSHQEGINMVGREVGSPIMAISGPEQGAGTTAFFGPVVNPTPTGEQAARLWDGLLAVASISGFYEFKRTRTLGPIFDLQQRTELMGRQDHQLNFNLRRSS
jgi:hypothetical protein